MAGYSARERLGINSGPDRSMSRHAAPARPRRRPPRALRRHRGVPGPAARRTRVPGPPRRQHLARGRLEAPGRPAVERVRRRDRRFGSAEGRLRIRALGRRADRHPVRGGRQPHATRRRVVRLRGRERRRALPDPDDVPIEGGAQSDGDRHVLLVDKESCTLYELFAASPQDDGSWHAGSGAIWNLKSNSLRPDGWTSADAAGLPILPGLVRYDEVARGVDRPRDPRHRAAHPAGQRSGRRATSRAAAPMRHCRRWDCASG